MNKLVLYNDVKKVIEKEFKKIKIIDQDGFEMNKRQKTEFASIISDLIANNVCIEHRGESITLGENAYRWRRAL